MLLWAGLVVGLLSPPLSAGDHLLLVGGGPVPQDSQVSIESNVIWIDRILRERGFDSKEVMFAGGDNGAPDVVLHAPERAEVQRWLPLARIHGEPHAGVASFRRNQLAGIARKADADAVDEALRQALGGLGPDDSLWFVFNGHGAWGAPNATHNALRLWGETALDVKTYADRLAQTPAGATVRHFLPQCFSGGFVRALFKDPAQPRADAVRPGQCGFFAVPENLESEGCTPGVDVGEYRDYSNFFFAALDGRTRLGGALARDPDVNGDGRVSLSEAHGYAYTEGFSTDMPFATSEYFLELWQPWYVRWQSALKPAADDPYLRRAWRLAEVLGMRATSATALARAALASRRALEQAAAEQLRLIEQIAEHEHTVRTELLAAFLLAWPAAAQPYSHAYVALLESEAEPMLAWIRALAEYPVLEALQIELEQAHLQLLDGQRRITAFARVHRMLKLATLRTHFERTASAEARATLAALEACENWVPPAPTAPPR